ncbi:MAG: Gldg family protein [Gammaproteobacteria bacterium]|nr:Gldg family protein [Gammaproteobacteria bacterium]
MAMKRSTLGAGAVVLLGVLFVALTVLSAKLLRGARLDLTENRLYTLAPGTARIVGNLAEPVNLYFFFSAEGSTTYPALRTYGTRVREFLQELVSRSGGKLRLTVIDPQPFSEEEDRAAELGVRAVPLGGEGKSFYFGLGATNSTDGRAAIDFFDPAKESFLEYDVAKLIHQLSTPRKPVVAWLSSLPMSGGFDPTSGQASEPWLVLGQAEQLFDVRPLQMDAKAIGADVDVLAVVHPKGLSPATQYAIDQFALRGGHVLMFVDPLAESDPSDAEPGNPLAALGADRASDPGRLLAAWGVAFDRGQVIGDLERGLVVSMRPGEPPTRHIGILGLDASSLNDGDVITATLTSVNLASAGFLAPQKDAATKFEPLLSTSTQAAPLPASRFQMLMDPATLREGFRPTGQRYTLAARVTGNVRSAFPDGPPAGAEGGTETHLAASRKPLNLVIVADSDLLSDFLWVRQQNLFGQRVAQAWANNGDLVWNALDNLAGSNDLISIRGRATFTRPFDRVDALRLSAEDRFRAKEQELEQQLQDTEQKLAALETGRNESSEMLLTPEQEQELERFQREKLRIRKELRDVRLQLDQDIRELGNRLRFTNIVVVPLIFAGLTLLVAVWRRRRQAAIAMLQRDRERLPGAGGQAGT